jgi:hypothetical protein
VHGVPEMLVINSVFVLLANFRFWSILLKNSLVKPLLLSRVYRCELFDPALPDFLFSIR